MMTPSASSSSSNVPFQDAVVAEGQCHVYQYTALSEATLASYNNTWNVPQRQSFSDAVAIQDSPYSAYRPFDSSSHAASQNTTGVYASESLDINTLPTNNTTSSYNMSGPAGTSSVQAEPDHEQYTYAQESEVGVESWYSQPSYYMSSGEYDLQGIGMCFEDKEPK